MNKNIYLYGLIAIVLLVVIYVHKVENSHNQNKNQFTGVNRTVQRQMDADFKKARKLAHQSPAIIVRQVNLNFSRVPQFIGRCRKPANKTQIRDAEHRLGVSLPKSTKRFYMTCNGIENTGGDSPFATYSVQALKRGSERNPKMSDKVIAIQKAYKQKVGGRIYLTRIKTYNDVLKQAFTNSGQSISLQDLDKMIFLSSNPKKIQVVAVVIDKNAGLKPGQVLDVEGAKGTIYGNISEWLASFSTW